MQKLLDLLSTTTEEIAMFSVEHFAWLIFYVLVLLFLVIKCRNISQFKLRLCIFLLGLTFLIFEILKVYIIHADAEGNWDIRIEHFQFQFCSMPVYVTSIIAIIPFKKLYNIGLTFLATYCIIAGLSSVILCDSISTTNAFMQFHTFYLHGGMFVLGLYLLITKKIDFKLSSFLGAAILFLILALSALTVNILTYKLTPDYATDFFYISPYVFYTPSFIDPIRESFPYIIYLLGYLLGFTGLSFGLFKLTSINIKNKKA